MLLMGRGESILSEKNVREESCTSGGEFGKRGRAGSARLSGAEGGDELCDRHLMTVRGQGWSRAFQK